MIYLKLKKMITPLEIPIECVSLKSEPLLIDSVVLRTQAQNYGMIYMYHKLLHEILQHNNDKSKAQIDINLAAVKPMSMR